MPDPKVSNIVFYWGKAKHGECNSTQVQFTSGREPLFGAEGILAYSKGTAKMRITIREVTPIKGSTTTDDIEKILNQDDIDCGFILGGKFMRESLAVLEATYSSDTEKKVTTGEIVLEGRKPKIIG